MADRWGDWLEVSISMRNSAVERRRAEDRLLGVLEDLTEGERVTVARRAGSRVLDRLAGLTEARVLVALLGNPRAVELQARAVAESEDAPAEALRSLAEHPRWGERREIREALVKNPATPVATALRLVESFPETDLRALLDSVKVPRIVRAGAYRKLGSPSEELLSDGDDDTTSAPGGRP